MVGNCQIISALSPTCLPSTSSVDWNYGCGVEILPWQESFGTVTTKGDVCISCLEAVQLYNQRNDRNKNRPSQLQGMADSEQSHNYAVALSWRALWAGIFYQGGAPVRNSPGKRV